MTNTENVSISFDSLCGLPPSESDTMYLILEAITDKLSDIEADILHETNNAEKLKNDLSETEKSLFELRKRQKLLKSYLKRNGFSDVLMAYECSEKMKE